MSRGAGMRVVGLLVVLFGCVLRSTSCASLDGAHATPETELVVLLHQKFLSSASNARGTFLQISASSIDDNSNQQHAPTFSQLQDHHHHQQQQSIGSLLAMHLQWKGVSLLPSSTATVIDPETTPQHFSVALCNDNNNNNDGNDIGTGCESAQQVITRVGVPHVDLVLVDTSAPHAFAALSSLDFEEDGVRFVLQRGGDDGGHNHHLKQLLEQHAFCIAGRFHDAVFWVRAQRSLCRRPFGRLSAAALVREALFETSQDSVVAHDVGVVPQYSASSSSSSVSVTAAMASRVDASEMPHAVVAAAHYHPEQQQNQHDGGVKVEENAVMFTPEDLAGVGASNAIANNVQSNHNNEMNSINAAGESSERFRQYYQSPEHLENQEQTHSSSSSSSSAFAIDTTPQWNPLPQPQQLVPQPQAEHVVVTEDGEAVAEQAAAPVAVMEEQQNQEPFSAPPPPSSSQELEASSSSPSSSSSGEGAESALEFPALESGNVGESTRTRTTETELTESDGGRGIGMEEKVLREALSRHARVVEDVERTMMNRRRSKMGRNAVVNRLKESALEVQALVDSVVTVHSKDTRRMKIMRGMLDNADAKLKETHEIIEDLTEKHQQQQPHDNNNERENGANVVVGQIGFIPDEKDDHVRVVEYEKRIRELSDQLEQSRKSLNLNGWVRSNFEHTIGEDNVNMVEHGVVELEHAVDRMVDAVEHLEKPIVDGIGAMILCTIISLIAYSAIARAVALTRDGFYTMSSTRVLVTLSVADLCIAMVIFMSDSVFSLDLVSIIHSRLDQQSTPLTKAVIAIIVHFTFAANVALKGLSLWRLESLSSSPSRPQRAAAARAGGDAFRRWLCAVGMLSIGSDLYRFALLVSTKCGAVEIGDGVSSSSGSAVCGISSAQAVLLFVAHGTTLMILFKFVTPVVMRMMVTSDDASGGKRKVKFVSGGVPLVPLEAVARGESGVSSDGEEMSLAGVASSVGGGGSSYLESVGLMGMEGEVMSDGDEYFDLESQVYLCEEELEKEEERDDDDKEEEENGEEDGVEMESSMVVMIGNGEEEEEEEEEDVEELEEDVVVVEREGEAEGKKKRKKKKKDKRSHMRL